MRSLRQLLEEGPIRASAPCRVDVGGTLDIATLHYPLRAHGPLTVNIAVGLRTRVRLLPYRRGRVRVESAGVGEAEYPADAAPFDHPLGLMFAVAARFGASGVRISIASDSPPRSGLGGSSVAAVALVAALAAAGARRGDRPAGRRETALLAHGLESAVAGVPCGYQDQLAAVYGGVHAWRWPGDPHRAPFRRKVLVPASGHRRLERRLLLAYCGVTHESAAVNRKWVQRFVQGRDRKAWREILRCTLGFAEALAAGDFPAAARWMRRECTLRREMTPEVLTPLGVRLAEAAQREGGAARFTGAGAGGCVWAVGPAACVSNIRRRWEALLEREPEARLLPFSVDRRGVQVDGGAEGAPAG